MLAVSGYRTTAVLYQGMRITIYRALRVTDGAPVILKCLERPRDGTSDLARFRREYEITRRLNGPGTVTALDFATGRQGPVLILADSGGLSVARARAERPLTLRETLRIGAAIAGALSRIHAGHVIHKDVNPANIVWNRDSGVIELIDFSIAAELARETSPSDIDQLEGTLAYIAPEQTGRMNRSLDWRSDFYSLGATLYDLLTGRAPYEGGDALSVIHGHIARSPIPPGQLNPALPPVVSDLVLRLMAKDPERRYQSAQGVAADLEICLDSLTEAGTIPGFALGGRDLSPRFHIPEKLHGREADVARLLDCFEEVAAGAARLVLVNGPPGIGKSALVQELQRPLIGRRGFFPQGKYDQFKRNIPYSGLVQAFQRLARRLLTESEAEMAARRAVLSRAIGASGALVTELIPEFIPILGPQPPVPPMPPAESEFRFQMTFQNLVVALASAHEPLVLALDDLQWADRSSLALLAKLIADPEMHYLMVIGTCRSEEAEANPALGRAVEAITQAGGRVATLDIGPLSAADVRRLVGGTTRRDDPEVDRLADLCHAKTQGNPFFLIQFLQSLHDDDLITLDREAGRWTWDAAAIAGRNSTDNVVSLMVAKIRRLEAGTGRALSLAACVGNSFDLATLAVASKEDPERLAGDLWPALKDGLILPLDNAYRCLTPGIGAGMGAGVPLSVRFRFLHDRVQQAAYSLIPEQDRTAAHLRIGRLLRAESPACGRDDRLFDIVDQLTLGRDLITDPGERHAFAALALDAARRAKASAAFEPALAYARAGLSRLGDQAWREDYSTLLGLHLEAAEAALMVDDFSGMESHAHAVLANANSPVDAAKVQMIRLTAAAGRGDPTSAVAIGLEALEAHGVTLPGALGRLRLRGEVARGRAAILRARLGLIRRERGADPPHRAITARMLMAMVTTAIIHARHLLVPVAVRLLEVALPSRDIGTASFAYFAWALIRSVTGDVAGAVHTGTQALAQLDSEALRQRYNRVVVIAHYSALHWSVPPLQIRQVFLEAHHVALAAGDREYVVYGLAFRARTGWQCGVELAPFKAELDEDARILGRLGTTPYSGYIAGLRQAVEILETGSDHPARLEGGHFQESVTLGEFRKAGNGIVVTNLLTVKLALAVIFDDHDETGAILAEQMPNEPFIEGYATHPVALFLRALAETARPPAESAARRRLAARLEPALRLLRNAAAAGPTHQRHRLMLLESEWLRLNGRGSEAAERFEQAVAAAAESGHLQEEGIANERAAGFHAERGHATLERAYRQQARDAYRRWGAWAKVRQLEHRHPELVSVVINRAASDDRRTVSTTTDRFSSGSLDVTAMLKAAQAISKEIRRDALLETMLRIVLQNAGAERGLLLLSQGDRLVLAAEGDAGSDRFAPLPALPLDTPADGGLPRLPATVVSLAMRSGETVVLADAAADSRFESDPYIQARKPRSVLCLPLLRQSQRVGLLYLENNLATDAFAGDRLEAPRLLAAQIAISLENARLYDELSDFSQALEAQVAERTRELSAALASERQAHDQLRAAQKQLVQAEKMASLGQLVAGMAHEINTPIGNALTSVTYLAEATHRFRETAAAGNIRRSDFNAFVATLGETTEIMVTNIRRAVYLVDSFKKVAADRARDEQRRFELKPYLREIVLSLEPTWRRAGHTVVVDCPDRLVMDGFSGVIAQIITNMVVNSVPHGFPGGDTGTLTITVRERDDQTLILTYSDDGRGIAPEHRERVFDPFFTTRRSGGSTGLGLHIVYNLVTSKLGGRIDLVGGAGRGVRFVLTLPRIAPPEPPLRT
ncbi:MAG: AAA family ATPase [Rhodospirillaceae bacterium]